MNLIYALQSRGYEKLEIRSLIHGWYERILDGENPEELLQDESLEANYVFDLLDYCDRIEMVKNAKK